MDRRLAAKVAATPRVEVTNELFYRHVSLDAPLAASLGGGRWGPPGRFPVYYFGRPVPSVVAEAHRHLVEPIEGMRPELVRPRKLLTCKISATELLDLRAPGAAQGLGLSHDDLTSNVGDYNRCWAVGVEAHRLELHGILAPAATGIGVTLALFAERLPVDEYPQLEEQERWLQLPPDPRRLRLVVDELGS